MTGDLDVDAVLRQRDEIVGNWDDEGQVRVARGRGRDADPGPRRGSAGERRVDVEVSGGQMRELEATARGGARDRARAR